MRVIDLSSKLKRSAGQGSPSNESNDLYRRAIMIDDSFPHEAIDLLTGALILDPRNDLARIELGRCLYMIGSIDDALSNWERVKLPHPVCFYNRGRVMLERNDLTEAERLFRRAVHVDPLMWEAWYWLADLLERRGVLNESLVAWHRFLESADGARPSWLERAREAIKTSVLSSSK